MRNLRADVRLVTVLEDVNHLRSEYHIAIDAHCHIASRMRRHPQRQRATRNNLHTSAYVSIRHTSAYVSIRQHTSAYVSIRQHTSYVSMRQHTSANVSKRQHTSAYVSIRQHTSAYVSTRPEALDDGPRQQGCRCLATQVCQNLYFCTSKASKLLVKRENCLAKQVKC